MVPTRKRSEAYGTYCNELVGPETYTTTQMVFFSPDMNPTEHLWDEVERRMKKEQSKNEKDLQECLTRVWNGIEEPVLKKLVDSVPNRLNEVIRMKGYSTRY